jgi:hypothetical protein
VASPGEHARCRGADACVGLVGGTEREWGARGARPRSLSRARAMEGAGFHPRGWQVE